MAFMKHSVFILFAVTMACTCIGFSRLESSETEIKDQQAIEERSPRRLFVNRDGTLTPKVIELLTIDSLYTKGDDLKTAVEKTQKAWVSVRQGQQNRERVDVQDSEERVALKDSVEGWAQSMGLFAKREPCLRDYTYGVCHGAFLDGVRKNLAQLVAAWKEGVRFRSLVFLTGERPLRKAREDSIEKLCDEKASPLPFKEGWRFSEAAPYETEYDMVKLVFAQVQLPKGMEEALRGKIVFVNAPKGKENRPSTKDAFRAWVREYQPEKGTVLACSYPLLWSYQQLAGESALQGTGLFLDTVAPQLSKEMRQAQTKRIVSLIFDTVAKCLYECNQKSESIEVRNSGSS